MARCVPFPPPGYVKDGLSGEALLMVIKMRIEKAEAEKKRKKEEKKRKKREEKEELEEGEIREERCGHKHKKNEELEEGEIREERCGYKPKKNGELEEGEIREERCRHKHKKSKKVGETKERQMQQDYTNGFSETSNVTEEHNHPMSDSFYDSSDNTENIRRKITVTSVVNDLAPRPQRELLCGSLTADEKAETTSAFSSSECCLQDVAAKYEELFADGAFPPFRFRLPESDDQEWLFKRKLPKSDTTQVSNAWNPDPHSRSPSLYPSAHYLPEADIHALPFTLLL